MSKEDLKKIGAQVSEEILVSMKILALKRRLTLQEYIAEVLTKHVQSKSKAIETAEEI